MSPGSRWSSSAAATISCSWSSETPVKSGRARTSSYTSSDRRQVAVDQVDGHAALADGGGDPLHRVEPDVAGREHAGGARLERERRSFECPLGIDRLDHLRAGDHEPVGVAGDLGAEPVGAWGGTD